MGTAASAGLRLADGTRWTIHATDEGSAAILSLLGEAMQLGPGAGPGRDLLIAVRHPESAGPRIVPLPPGLGPHPLACLLALPENRDELSVQAMRAGLAIAREALVRGAVLVHGALASLPCPEGGAGTEGAVPGRAAPGRSGVVLAGPGGVGKSTASGRFPAPWRSLCDDMTLIVPGGEGRYLAHPWPTWSRFFGNGPGHSVDVQAAVPLRAIFFLSRSERDRAAPLKKATAAALLMASVHQACHVLERGLDDPQVRSLHAAQFAAVEALARAVPAHRLGITLTGAFWEEVERALSGEPSGPVAPPGHRHPAGGNGPGTGTGLPLAIERREAKESGPCVRPENGLRRFLAFRSTKRTEFRVPEILDVLPCQSGGIRAGDLVCCRVPHSVDFAVLRALEASNGTVSAAADRDPRQDAFPVPASKIVGRVVVAEQGGRTKTVARGRHGRLERVVARCRARGLGLIEAVERDTAGAVARLFPRFVCPGLRVMLFHDRPWPRLALMAGSGIVGRFDIREDRWRVRRPFGILVSAAELDRRAERTMRLFPDAPLGGRPPAGPPGVARQAGEEAEEGGPVAEREFPGPVTPEFVPVPNPSAVFREALEDWAVLVDMDSSNALSLNPTGARVWRLVDGRRSVRRIAGALRREVEDAPENLLEDVLAYVEVLLKQGMVGCEVR